MQPNTIEDTKLVTEKEIRGVLKYCNFCTMGMGLSLIDEPRNIKQKFGMNVLVILCVVALALQCCGNTVYKIGLLKNAKSVAEVVPGLHLNMYSYLSLSKLVTLWFKRNAFKKLIIDLVNIWPKDVNEKEGTIKKSSITACGRLQFWYIAMTMFGLIFYCITPLALTIYHKLRGNIREPTFIWYIAYPFDKTDPFFYKIVYVYETFSGYTTAGGVLSSEIMFTVMASNISMLLRVLQSKIKDLAFLPSGNVQNRQSTVNVSLITDDGYDKIVSVINIHQKLISYSVDLENAFSLLNLSNVLISSMMVCCVVFNIALLDPWMELSNKFFLFSVLSQVGIMCWYADDVYRSSMSVADAVYQCPWYDATPRCRRALLLMLVRSQKPICFTAFKFSDITMITYSSILTTSYSYFALLYNMFQSNN